MVTVLLDVLYERETLFLTLKVRLKVFKSRALIRTFVRKKQDVPANWIKTHVKELHIVEILK